MVSTYYTSTTLNVISQERDHMSVSAKELQENYSLSVIFFCNYYWGQGAWERITGTIPRVFFLIGKEDNSHIISLKISIFTEI